jgi:hypothetical protein
MVKATTRKKRLRESLRKQGKSQLINCCLIFCPNTEISCSSAKKMTVEDLLGAEFMDDDAEEDEVGHHSFFTLQF